jgi:hypothetical protein
MQMTCQAQNEDVALAAASWSAMGVEIELTHNGKRADDPRTKTERGDAYATYQAILKHPQKLGIAVKTGPKSGLVALTAYTYEPGVGMHTLEDQGYFRPCCDTLIRHEIIVSGVSEGRFHTCLFYSGKDQFLEGGLDLFPGVFVRRSGELIPIPPTVEKFVLDEQQHMRSCYEQQDVLAPAGITIIPDGLRKIIRASERQSLTAKRQTQGNGGVRKELYDTVTEGGRNNALARRAGFLIRVHKLTEEQLLEELMIINQRCCQPPLGFCEVRNTARSIFKKHSRHG